eukprot:gene4839-2251_t
MARFGAKHAPAASRAGGWSAAPAPVARIGAGAGRRNVVGVVRVQRRLRPGRKDDWGGGE